ncbi:M14 family metallopeptidase [Maribacter sp. MAR_2009_72]|uniref:M14 family metallopeptidase n=1 Tax=Maribacter sp. MAR_2009_72 TaxID=1250050 RepID=UPI00119A061F|nr:M14 family metallopeptidase [Maribacter sp. MAR_2009_72]TVZ14116.1 zinc carboxypeptidase [Maribacter sp. MAR_2009_72]
MIKKLLSTIFICYLVLSCTNQKPVTTGYQGQGKSAIVSTLSKPVQKQWKGIWSFEDGTTFFTNDFESGRLNGIAYDGNDHYTALITAENTPINVSPWYAFKVWSTTPKTITIKMTYQDSRSRYYPKLSTDGIHFTPLDSANFNAINEGTGTFGIKAVPEFVEIKVNISEKPLYITAQELYGSTRVKQWVDSMSTKPYVTTYEIGRSRENRSMNVMQIKEGSHKKAVMVISRQHPPEVTGFLAMKSFIETLAGDSPEAQDFRNNYDLFVVPLMNPDGVDNGHWRHNMGGIDLNRDWENFNQPETRSVRDFLVQKEDEGYEFVFGADFHSTWDDIYYPIDSTIIGKKGEIIFNWIENISNRLPQKHTNIKPSTDIKPTMVSRNYFYVNHDMPAIVFELGDNTPRDFLRLKGKIAAEELMKLLLQ